MTIPKTEGLSTESHEHGLWLQLNAKFGKYARLDFILQRDDVGGGSSTAIHDCQGVSAGNSGRTTAVTLGEACVLDQPCSRELAKRFSRGIAGQGQISCT